MISKRILAEMALVGALALGPSLRDSVHADSSRLISFPLVASNAAVSSCLPHATGSVVVIERGVNERMLVQVAGLLPNTGYDLFLTNQATPPFGPAWYQSDLETNSYGGGTAVVQGIFNHETFMVSQGQGAAGNGITFPAVHTFNLGLWFNNPQDPFRTGCEPGKAAPVVTPFNGEQNAGIQVLRTQVIDPNNLQNGPLANL